MQKLKEILTKNIGLKLAAIAIAFVIWLVVVNVSNPEITATKTVNVEVRNENVIADVGKTYEINGSTTVTVSYSVRTRDAYLISASDFNAYVDLKDLYDVTGSVPISVEVVNHENLIVGTPTVRPSVLHVTVDDVSRKKLEIKTMTQGEVRDGYTLNGISLDANSVYISGPKALLDTVEYADVTIPLDGLDESINGTANIVLHNSKGDVVLAGDDRITMNRTTVGYVAEVISGKNIPVSYGYVGTPAQGYRFTGLEVSVGSVNVQGSKEGLDSIQAITVPETEVNIQDATSNVVVEIDLNRFIPEGLTVSGNSVATVVAKIEPITEKVLTFDKSEIALEGIGPGYIYEVSPDSIDVVLTGLAEELAMTEKNTVQVIVDLAGRTPGEYLLTPRFVVPENVAVKSYTPFVVRISTPEPETAETLEGTEGTESEEGAEGETIAEIIQGEIETAQSETEESAEDETDEDETEKKSETSAAETETRQ